MLLKSLAVVEVRESSFIMKLSRPLYMKLFSSSPASDLLFILNPVASITKTPSNLPR